MKRIFKETFSFIIYWWYRISHKLPQISSIYFHDPSPDLFETILRWYSKYNYRFISLKDLILLLEKKETPLSRLAFISFDDGWRSNMDLIPLCEKYNVPITVFVATEPLKSGNYWWEYASKKLGRSYMLKLKKLPETDFYAQMAVIKKGIMMERSSMTVEELKLFARHPLVTIQSHSVNHPVLTNTSDETLMFELTESKRELEAIIGRTVDVFSYPNGNVGQREICALKKARYQYAFTTDSETFDVEHVNPYLLPRMAINTRGGKFENLAKITGIWYKVMRKR